VTSAVGEIGLTSDQVDERRRRGEVNVVEVRGSRSVADILRANILTKFNAIITVLLVVVLVFGRLPDALFGFVMVINSIIGIVQELRAKHTLDSLRVLVAPEITVVRDGEETVIPVEEIVLDDLFVLVPGDQVPVDGPLTDGDGLEIDESLLTGEVDLVDKHIGDDVYSGSFVVAGTGRVVARAVGNDAYAPRLAAEAKEFTLAKSGLREGIDKILNIVIWLLIPTSALLLWSQLQTGRPLSEAMVSTVAGIVGMIPQGLVLLVSMTLAVAVVRLGKRNALVQELPAVETLARVDVICVDKTGTLTSGVIRHETTSDVGSESREDLEYALAALAAADPHPNPTLAALKEAYPETRDWDAVAATPFSSARKFSAVEFAEHGTWVMGAPAIVLEHHTAGVQDLRERLGDLASTGRRVLVVARSDEPLGEDHGLPGDLIPVGYLTFVEEVRPDAAQTVAYFVDQGVTPKVISGDSPRTVGAIAAEVGIPAADHAVDAGHLPAVATEEFGTAIEENSVFGRVNPDQKRYMVESLQRSGHTVAMTGDGVNDVLALKKADIGVAMGSGSPATRAVAQVVLLDNKFSSLPAVVAEGRRVIANMERVSSLFVTKTVYATILAILIGFAGVPFPLLPRHLTLIGSLTIGIPGFFLSFEPTEEPVRRGAFGRVLRFAIPAGIVAAAAAFFTYGLAISSLIAADLPEARTATTITMILVGLWILVELIQPLTRERVSLVAALGAASVLILITPFGRTFFALVIPSLQVWGVIIGVTIVAIFLVHWSLIGVDRLWHLDQERRARETSSAGDRGITRA
jgi:cation-transporting ATPase E